MSHTVSHTDINVAIAKMLGIDPEDGVVAFTVDVEKDRYPLVTVTCRCRDVPEAPEDVTSTYKLVPVAEAEVAE